MYYDNSVPSARRTVTRCFVSFVIVHNTFAPSVLVMMSWAKLKFAKIITIIKVLISFIFSIFDSVIELQLKFKCT